jgi:hypothetical protein
MSQQQVLKIVKQIRLDTEKRIYRETSKVKQVTLKTNYLLKRLG